MKQLLLTCSLIISGLSAFSQNWQDLNAPLGANIVDIDRSGTNIFGTTTANGLIKSTDGGQNWTTITSGIPSGTPTLFCVTSDGKLLLGKMDPGGPNGLFPFYTSSDNGANWTLVTGNVPASGGIIKGFANGIVLFIPTYNGISVMKISFNSGMTWKNTNVAVKSAFVAPNGNIYGLKYNTGSGNMELVSSSDTVFNSISSTNMLSNAENIYIAKNGNIYLTGGANKVSSNNGTSFTTMDSNFTNIWADANNNLFAFKAGLACRKSSSATSWEVINNGLTSFGISGFYAHSNGNVYVSSGSKFLKFVSGSTGIATNTIESQKILYPNPANKYIMFDQLKDKVLRADLYGIDGKSIPTVVVGDRLMLDNVANGLYLLNITFDNGYTTNQRVMVSH